MKESASKESADEAAEERLAMEERLRQAEVRVEEERKMKERAIQEREELSQREQKRRAEQEMEEKEGSRANAEAKRKEAVNALSLKTGEGTSAEGENEKEEMGGSSPTTKVKKTRKRSCIGWLCKLLLFSTLLILCGLACGLLMPMPSALCKTFKQKLPDYELPCETVEEWEAYLPSRCLPHDPASIEYSELLKQKLGICEGELAMLKDSSQLSEQVQQCEVITTEDGREEVVCLPLKDHSSELEMCTKELEARADEERWWMSELHALNSTVVALKERFQTQAEELSTCRSDMRSVAQACVSHEEISQVHENLRTCEEGLRTCIAANASASTDLSNCRSRLDEIREELSTCQALVEGGHLPPLPPLDAGCKLSATPAGPLAGSPAPSPSCDICCQMKKHVDFCQCSLSINSVVEHRRIVVEDLEDIGYILTADQQDTDLLAIAKTASYRAAALTYTLRGLENELSVKNSALERCELTLEECMK